MLDIPLRISSPIIELAGSYHDYNTEAHSLLETHTQAHTNSHTHTPANTSGCWP